MEELAENQKTLDDAKVETKAEDEILNKMVEVELIDEESFLIIKETLTRIGVPNKSRDALYQSCHILHKKGKYYICHFKTLFELDNRPSNFDEDDRKRLNAIVSLLQEWDLVKVKDQNLLEPKIPVRNLTIIPFKEKSKWELVEKYKIGVRH